MARSLWEVCRRSLAVAAYLLLMAAGIGGVWHPPQSLDLGLGLTRVIGALLLAGGALGVIGVLTRLTIARLAAFPLLISGVLCYAIPAAAMAFTGQPTRLLQAGCLAALAALLSLRGVELWETARYGRARRLKRH